MLIEAAHNLERAGADLIVIPCNTAHFYLKKLQQEVQVPIIDMIAETIKRITGSRIGLLATNGTERSGIYYRVAKSEGITLIAPERDDQALLMHAIYAIKSGTVPDRFQDDLFAVSRRIEKAGAEGAILGCTGLSLVPLSENLPIPIYDALTVLTQTVLAQAF